MGGNYCEYVVQKLRGMTASGAHTTLAYIGVSEGLRYVFQFIVERLVVQFVSRETLHFEDWSSAVKAADLNVDLLVVVSSNDEIGAIRRSDDIYALSRMHQVVPTNKPFDEISKAMSKREVKRGHVLRSEGFYCMTSVEDDDFLHFYRTMHRPTMDQRYGDAARSVDESEAYSQLFKKGILFKVFQNETWVAGSVSHIENMTGTLNARLLGVKDGDPQHRFSGAQNFVYHSILGWACSSEEIVLVDFQGCEPFLTKGTFQYKRRFGAHAVVPENAFGNLYLLLRPNLRNDDVRSFLINNPVLVPGASGSIEARYFYDRHRPAREDVPFECPGISYSSQYLLR